MEYKGIIALPTHNNPMYNTDNKLRTLSAHLLLDKWHDEAKIIHTMSTPGHPSGDAPRCHTICCVDMWMYRSKSTRAHPPLFVLSSQPGSEQRIPSAHCLDVLQFIPCTLPDGSGRCAGSLSVSVVPGCGLSSSSHAARFSNRSTRKITRYFVR